MHKIRMKKVRSSGGVTKKKRMTNMPTMKKNILTKTSMKTSMKKRMKKSIMKKKTKQMRKKKTKQRMKKNTMKKMLLRMRILVWPMRPKTSAGVSMSPDRLPVL